MCVWPAGTGTADPPLTPGGVYRALEEEEGRVVECLRVCGRVEGGYRRHSKRNIPFRPEKEGAMHNPQ